ncbi:hypothetical protein B0T13DRAFT_486202 [Neurospora crassa]|nr:hypothetical protein B0T13DRAFT_486202 [Neurospora crassa]
MATTQYDTIIFDLGDVLFDWNEPEDVASLVALPKGAMRIMMNSTTWHDLDRGLLPAEEAYKIMGDELHIEASLVRHTIDTAACSLQINEQWAELVKKLAAKPGLKVYAMSNISKERFEYIRTLPFPWEAFTRVFTSAAAGMRKPDLCFYQYVINETGCDPSRVIFLDDRTENIVAARSLGIRGEIVTEKERTKEGRIYRFLRNVVLGEPIALAEAFLHSQSGNLDSVYSEEGVIFMDNFSQLLIWGLTDMEDIIYLLWPDGTRWKGSSRCSSPDDDASVASSTDSAVVLNDKARDGKKSRPLQDGLWNYFTEKPVGTTEAFPADVDTTSIAYLTIPQEHLHRVADPKLVLDAMISNVNVDGIMQVYFTNDRPRICAIVSVNMLRFFLKYGGDDLDLDTDPQLAATLNFVINCLVNNAVINGTRHYTTIESFLYFVSLFFDEIRPRAERNPTRNANTRQTLQRHIYQLLVQSLGKPANPLALAMRVRACQVFGIDRDLLKTGAVVGSRGLTTAMAWRILKDYEREAFMFSFSFPVHTLDCVGSTIASLTNRQLFASTSATGIMSRTHWDDGLHAVNGTDAPEAVLPGQQVPKEPVSTRWIATYPQYSPLVRPNSPEKQDQEQSGHFLPQSNASSPGLKRKICGLRRSTFFLIVALLAVIVVAAVGGGVGGSIAVKKAKSSPPSSTTFDCAAVAASGSQIITMGDQSWKFDVKCNLKFKGNVNLAASIAYSFEECLHSCAQTNWLLRNETQIIKAQHTSVPRPQDGSYRAREERENIISYQGFGDREACTGTTCG